MSTFKQVQQQKKSVQSAPVHTFVAPDRPAVSTIAPISEATTGEMQAKLEHARRFGYSLAHLSLSPREQTIQPKHSVQRAPQTTAASTATEPVQIQNEAHGSAPRENNTGLPDRLKAGVEHLSGIAMDDVRVHYNSFKPAEVQALAYTQGADIHVGPGQEKHLAHEAWHVVQQKEGRVKPTLQKKGIKINNDKGLEREADVMGQRVLGTQSSHFTRLDNGNLGTKNADQNAPTQRVIQRALSYVTPPTQVQLDTDLLANPKSIVRFSQAETLSKDWGVASNTAAFTNALNSNYLEGGGLVPITWTTGGGHVLGYLRPLGKIKPAGFDPNVKMHLVNSFLHPDANTWPLNWIFGHGDLNHDHENTIESEAKDYHPANVAATKKNLGSGEPIYALSYRTEIVTKATTTKTVNDLADEIATRINFLVPFGYASLLRNDVLTNVNIMGQSVATYHATWQTAIGNAVAKKVESFLRIYGIDATTGDIVQEDIALGSVEDNAGIDFRAVINANVDGMQLAGWGIITLIPPPPGGGRAKRSLAPKGGSTGKKGKTG